MTEQAITDLVKQLRNLLRNKQLMLVTAESCTGGGLGYALTELPGSSDWYESGYITYSNASKITLLGVKQTTIAQYGAVSENTVLEMASGALKNSAANISIAITGVAGPSGSEQKAPGMVWIAWASKNHFSIQAELYHFKGDRHAVRVQSIAAALNKLISLLR